MSSLNTRIIFLASSFSGLFIVLSLAITSFLYDDIRSFHNEAIRDMEEFRNYANDAWTEMMLATAASSSLTSEALGITSRVKRRSSACGCVHGPRACPPGPSGPQGVVGEPGLDAPPGEPGQPGLLGISSSTIDDDGCTTCPAGPPGESGPDGDAGEPGLDGYPGKPGRPGRHGERGSRGQQGDRGPAGRPGRAGSHGRRGRNGKRGFGKRGKPGKNGVAGRRGKAGVRGQPGEDGHIGSAGERGPAGIDGYKGDDGYPGEPGQPGRVGDDAAYCPCPDRMDISATAAIGGPKTHYYPDLGVQKSPGHSPPDYKKLA